MSLESFRDLCNSHTFYYFKTLEDIENRIDWEGREISKNKLIGSPVDDREYPPFCFSIYGLK